MERETSTNSLHHQAVGRPGEGVVVTGTSDDGVVEANEVEGRPEVFAVLWQWLGRKGKEPSAPAKFGLALAQMGLANLVLVWGAEAYGVAAMTPVIFVFLYYLLATTGELCLSPVGLSAMNRLAPKFLASLIMGAWFYMTAVGNFVAGKIGEATGGHDGEMSKQALLDIYQMFGWIAIGAGVVVLLLSPIVKRWMHLDTLDERDPGDDLAGGTEVGEPQAAGVHPVIDRGAGESPAGTMYPTADPRGS